MTLGLCDTLSTAKSHYLCANRMPRTQAFTASASALSTSSLRLRAMGKVELVGSRLNYY